MNDHALFWYVFWPLITIILLLYWGLSALNRHLESIYNRLTGIHNELASISSDLKRPGTSGQEFFKYTKAAGEKTD